MNYPAARISSERSVDLYNSGEYLAAHPTWHREDAAWKARHVAAILARNGVSPGSICDIGCGPGAVLDALRSHFPDAELIGRDISLTALEMSAPGMSLSQGSAEGAPYCDLALALDVFEHVDDYPEFLRAMRGAATHKVYHIPLDISVQAVLRGTLIRNREHSGHIHMFTRETALAALRESGHRVIDWRYTCGAAERPTTTMQRVMGVPRLIANRLAPDLASRVLGGYSLLVLCH